MRLITQTQRPDLMLKGGALVAHSDDCDVNPRISKLCERRKEMTMALAFGQAPHCDDEPSIAAHPERCPHELSCTAGILDPSPHGRSVDAGQDDRLSAKTTRCPPGRHLLADCNAQIGVAIEDPPKHVSESRVLSVV